MDPEQQLALPRPVAHVEQRLTQVQADRGDRLDPASAAAVRAGLGEQALQVGAAALAGHLDEAELRDVQDLDLRPVLLDLALQAGEDLLPVLLFDHVDQVDDDDPPQVAQADLADDL